MNHLSGLDHVPSLSLPTDDAAALDSFRATHEAARPPSFESSIRSPTHEIATSDLPPCGWRPLDDVTLYRFLCADRRNGKFQPMQSALRLKRALKFRKDEGVDEILGNRKAKRGADSPSPSSRDGSPAHLRCGSTVSLSSIASGRMCDVNGVKGFQATESPSKVVQTADEKLLANEAMGGNSAPCVSAFSPRELERYQRLRVRVFVGRDQSGQPVMFERLGEYLGSGNCSLMTDEEAIRFYVWDLERHFTEMREASMMTGKLIQRHTYFGDASGIMTAIMNRSIWKVIPHLKTLVKAVEEHYPEMADKIVLFNVPRVASLFYRAVRAFLDPVTAEKIELHPGIPLSKFEKIMPIEAIPVEYGGKNTLHFPPTE
uniref:CRAL-TRIO domain-containing protein n=1 Tax=Odontella aurita TaxID=265563 RepID=A0A7S4NFW5_9STRA|mmetsp:Transcript_61667/g.182189  ORF Transcript_61667/g.182189 Transcript_61667/m.182189 type:complete len:373 (+) Transcript_61667:50-1168(+)